jgi:hypothetical protein
MSPSHALSVIRMRREKRSLRDNSGGECQKRKERCFVESAELGLWRKEN